MGTFMGTRREFKFWYGLGEAAVTHIVSLIEKVFGKISSLSSCLGLFSQYWMLIVVDHYTKGKLPLKLQVERIL